MAKRRNLEQVFEALEDGIVAVTKDGQIFHTNTAAVRLLGGNLRSHTGENIDEILSERCGREVRLLQRAIGSGKPSSPERLQLRAGENGFFSVIARVQLLSDETGLLGAVVLLRDETEISRLRANLEGARGLENIVGASEPMQQVFQLVREVARTDATVLIQGETGTGKELVARAIHQLSNRADKPLVTVNCAALPEGLLESELFGHVKGAFTGALSDRLGRFEAADGGTLFLDEVAEIPPMIQVKLLRVLQERVFERVGENKPRRTDARLISATNKNLSDMVSEGRFREDLFYRLNVFPIHVPSLRERVDDIPLLVHRLLSRIADRHGTAVPGISDDVLRLFRSYRWPGNVRELQAALEYAMIRSQGATIDVHHLP
ncbi:MAG TPA: sigma 54-interacting transcriptional regulator, partial [Candidatus Latescibacteria bacterium]|nr:sigma 54-interacting transcriptional regulator [Candidatus Latescibacterota bacterium]